jgi:molybdate transport repressor ModE-like protein
MLKIIPSLDWKVTDGTKEEPLDPRLLPLLQAISDTGSLAAAVVTCRISYRAAWGMLRVYRQEFSCELVALERGRGAKLTPAGARLLEAHAVAVRRLRNVYRTLSLELVDDEPRDVNA